MSDIFERVAARRKSEGTSSGDDIFARVARRKADKAPAPEARGWIEGITPPGAPALPADLNDKDESKYRNLRTGRVTAHPTDQYMPILDSPTAGAVEASEGVAQMAEPSMKLFGKVPPMATGMTPPALDRNRGTSEDAKQLAGGVHKVMGGAFKAIEPLMVAGGVVAPIRTAVTLGVAMTADKATAAGLEHVGVPKEYADLAGDFAAILGGKIAHSGTEVFEAIRKLPAEDKAALKDYYLNWRKNRKASGDEGDELPPGVKPPPFIQKVRTYLDERQKAKAAKESAKVFTAPEPEIKTDPKLAEKAREKFKPADPTAPSAQGHAIPRLRGEKYSDYQKRKAAAPTSPAIADNPKAPVIDIKAEVERLKAENEKLRGKPAIEKPAATPKPTPSNPSTAPARKTATIPLTDAEKAKASSSSVKELQEQVDRMAASGGKGERADLYRDLLEKKKAAEATKKPAPAPEQKPATLEAPLPAPARPPKAAVETPLPEGAGPLEKTVAKLKAAQETGDPHWQAGEMVPVDDILPFREYDRTVEEKRPGHFEGVTKHVGENGIEEPVILKHDPKTGRTMLSEGNTRVAAAKAAGMTHVPVRVVSAEVPEKFPMSPGRLVDGEKVPADIKPSQIGFKSMAGETKPGIPETKSATPETIAPEAKTVTPAAETPAPVPPPEVPPAMAPTIDKIKANAVGRVRIQPVDGNLKPVGDPIDIDTGNPGWQTAAVNSLENRGNKGMAFVENLDTKPGTLKKFTVNLAEEGKPKAPPIPKAEPSKPATESPRVAKNPEPGGSRRQSPAIEPARKVDRPLIDKPKKATDRMSSEDRVRYDAMRDEYMKPATTPQRMNALERDMSALKSKYGRGARERGSAPAEFLSGGLSRMLEYDPDAPIENYSGWGAFKDLTVRNLSQLERASEKVHQAAVRAAVYKAKVATVLGTAIPEIKKALAAGNGPTWQGFREALIESRLIGARDRWIDMSSKVDEMSDKEIEESFKPWISGLLRSMENKKGLPQDLAATAATLIEQKDFPVLREFLKENFLDAADSVTSILPEDKFREYTENDGFKNALNIYKENVEIPVSDSHSLNEGVFSTALGPLDTYYPLTALTAEEGAARVSQGPGRRLPYYRPKNLNNRFTTGLSEAYDANMETFRQRLEAATRANSKAALMDAVRQAGLGYDLEVGDNGEVFSHHGIPYVGAKVEVSPQRLIIENGKVKTAAAQFMAVPDWMERELRPILDKDKVDSNIFKKVASKINAYALSGPLDAVFHSSNLMGALVANTPYLGRTLSDKGLSLPIAKRVAALVKTLTTDVTTPEARAQLVEMADLGLIPERYGTVTYDKDFAVDMGAELHRASFGPALFGPHGMDVKARLVMYRIAKEANPDITPLQAYHFVNQLGNYTKSLQGTVERWAKSTGMAPFYTAGSTMLRNGVNAWTGMGPMPSNAASLKVWQQLTHGGIATAGLWVTIHHAVTGKWPWEDTNAKFMQIPIAEEYRHTPLVEALYGDGNDTAYVNMAIMNPLVARGATALGVRGAVDTAILGGSGRQMFHAGVAGAINSIAHPFLGPGTRAAVVGLTGIGLGRPYEPYVFQGPAMLPVGPANMTTPQKLVHTAKELNPFMVQNPVTEYGLGKLDDFLQNLDIHTGLGNLDEKEKGSRFWKSVVNMSLPMILGTASDAEKRQGMLEKEEAQATRPIVDRR